MFVPQWGTAFNDSSAANKEDVPTTVEQPSVSLDGDNNMANSSSSMNGIKAAADGDANKHECDDDDELAKTESNDEGIEISSIVVASSESANNNTDNDDNVKEEEKLQTTTALATEYDMALHHQGSSSSIEEDDEDTMYQCQMWTASFPDDNHHNTNNDNNNNNNNNMSEGINSAFATLSGGDIWSTEAFSLPSPLHDLLSSNTPLTLDELLAQDELLQELRGCEVQLVEYFGRGEVVAELVECV
eukprot:CAMPEP_0113417086 /NCGR_PEP_ID=MMETSP0013_2-20120614/25465_1 /TAXON_ID=2843 ORGANISM="Skeletonema costatum, Strain 1716" /NCGR_SAMPLE_ID=MMETSP0013_2 /ASSEMBLY_ACC=CAM_ASM_000158 /LENGTH=244 /DNA_ID=CAMNT_0000304191 /DNA_START=230 /DNA_END=961 /DNA_ORIENTATION=- /assembly_acc=CAM_ASM_000158